MDRKRHSLNSFQRPHTYKSISQFFQQQRIHGVFVIDEDDTFKFQGSICDKWIHNEIPIRRLRDLTFGQWVDEFFYLKNKNEKDIL